MKKLTTLFLLVIILMSTVGCSKKTYSKEDIEVLELIETLDDLKGNGAEINYKVDYKAEKKMNNKYSCVITFVFGEHELEMSTIQNSAKEIKESFDSYEGNEIWKFKLDGIEYDYDTAYVLIEHYQDTMYVD